MESNSMFIKDETGNEKEMEILFTFDHQEKKYVIFRDINANDDEVFASAYNDDGELLPIEAEEEWQMVEEVLLAFTEEDDE
ncbi:MULTISPECIES: DUF1292 domain-containing protein [unclassified Breznakia]|uniref:DUF1292 domain-containing protein n=1 Tax=unclassified Breznakia TaxID=2623764 RepID=UPI00240493D9|nr:MULTISPECIES: DUF1292 domain-containing protein [unclassified Breznakia]MDF9838423.1 uncharacterized protein YrzB (UPF0473 family) [Breznakia sp. PFB2-8]MDF9860439.1 uncharacterized protein YrzB (UPF0473 family) [Breznakia sp. PH5-24]